MDLIEILQLLDSSTVKLIQNGLSGRKFSGVTLLTRAMGSAVEDREAIFFATTDYFNSLSNALTEDRAFFLFANAPLKPLSAGSFVAAVSDYEAWLRNFETIAGEFRLLQKKKEELFELTDLVNRGVSLQRVLDAAADLIGAPASILDNALSFLAVSRDFPDYVAHGEEQISRTLPPDAVELLKNKGLVNPKQAYDLFVFDWRDTEGNVYTNHFASIYSDESIVGSVSFLTRGGHLRRSRMAMMPAVAQILSIQMHRTNAYTLNKSLYYAHLFQQLRKGALPQQPDQVRERFSLFGYRLKRFIHAIYIDVSREYLPSEGIQALADRIASHVVNNVYSIEEGRIVMISSSDESGFRVGTLDAIREDLENVNATLGISSEYSDPLLTPSYLDEAQRSIAVGERLGMDDCIMIYDRARMVDMIMHVNDPQVLFSAQMPQLLRLYELDDDGKGGLVRTLYEYLIDPTHPAEVAERLFIHKNTLYYRLDKIKKVLGCDLHDGRAIADIIMTLRIMELRLRFDPAAEIKPAGDRSDPR